MSINIDMVPSLRLSLRRLLALKKVRVTADKSPPLSLVYLAPLVQKKFTTQHKRRAGHSNIFLLIGSYHDFQNWKVFVVTQTTIRLNTSRTEAEYKMLPSATGSINTSQYIHLN